MVEINRLKIKKFPEISYTDSPEGVPSLLLIGVEGFDSEEELYEVVENETETEDFVPDTRRNLNVNGSSITIQTNLDSLSKVQEVLDQISLSLWQFVREKVESMERNIYRLNNGDLPEVPNYQDLPLDIRMVSYLLAQGDNRNVEELLRTVHQNVVVNVNLSYYFKIMLVMLTFNTLLLFKWMVWDRLD